MKTYLSILLVLTATVLQLFGCVNPDARETAGEKTEWSILQAVEFENRSTTISFPIFRTIQDCEVLGIRGQNGNIWILLRVESPPYYKQMPSGNYDLPREVFDQLVKERRLSYTVEHVLESHLRPK